MPVYVIPFPAIDPVLVSIGPIAVRWYALAYIVGILLGWVYARAVIRRERLWHLEDRAGARAHVSALAERRRAHFHELAGSLA